MGTPYYMAPEVLTGQGYSFSVDYWSLGVCIYQMYYRCYPFGNGKDDVMEVYKDILNK